MSLFNINPDAPSIKLISPIESILYNQTVMFSGNITLDGEPVVPSITWLIISDLTNGNHSSISLEVNPITGIFNTTLNLQEGIHIYQIKTLIIDEQFQSIEGYTPDRIIEIDLTPPEIGDVTVG